MLDVLWRFFAKTRRWVVADFILSQWKRFWFGVWHIVDIYGANFWLHRDSEYHVNPLYVLKQCNLSYFTKNIEGDPMERIDNAPQWHICPQIGCCHHLEHYPAVLSVEGILEFGIIRGDASSCCTPNLWRNIESISVETQWKESVSW